MVKTQIIGVALVCFFVGFGVGYTVVPAKTVTETEEVGVYTCGVCGMTVKEDEFTPMAGGSIIDHPVMGITKMEATRTWHTCCPGCALTQYKYVHESPMLAVNSATIVCPDAWDPTQKITAVIEDESIISVTPEGACFFMAQPMNCAMNAVFVDRAGAESWQAEKNPEGMIMEGKMGLQMWLNTVLGM